MSRTRPEQCPECGFVWGEYQGHRYGYGYRQLAARVWECTRCGTTVRPRTASHQYVARG